ncbi:DnaD domain protein [Streptococcus uberis]|uniref:DnaD domain protein n=1 Tax=Streptococcus uberis TaxID=1349 RepID=UPI0012B5E1D5|nr:DnaD domain protein [Streptococcus uberis]MTB98539.1 DnaD domain protein [Streptococcus uberis]
MGNRRMISKTVTQTQRFLQMPLESQALYFHLIQNSDDDGVVEAFPIVRMIGANEDNLKLLNAKNFIRPLNDEMVYFIIDFFEQNQIKSNQYKPSRYQSLLTNNETANNLRFKEKFKVGSNVEQVLNPNISQDNISQDNISQENESQEKIIEDRLVESKITSKKDIYIYNFDPTQDFSKNTKIEDLLGENYLTDLSDNEFITGLTYYCFNRQADQYEINTLKKRLNTIDRKLLEKAYYLAGLNGANTLAYIVTILDRWKELDINTIEELEEHEYQREQARDDADVPF